MRFRDLLRDINRHEQKLENVLLYVDFMDHDVPVILLKDGSLLTLFQLAGLDYDGLSEEEKEQFSHYARVALEQLPDEGAGFMLSNLLIRDTPQPLPLRKNPEAHPLVQFLQSRKKPSGMIWLPRALAIGFSAGCAISPEEKRASLGTSSPREQTVPILPRPAQGKPP